MDDTPVGRRRRWEPVIPWALAGITLITRLAVAVGVPVEWDSVQLVYGLDHFDVRVDSPHAPGYWLYVAAGRLVRVLTPLSGHASLVLVSAAVGAAAVAVAYLLGRQLGGIWLGLAAAAFLVTSPYVWFYGSIAATYGLDALALLVLALVAVRALPGGRHGIAAAGVLGVAAGFRPSVVLLAGPLVVLALWRTGWRARDVALGGAAAVAGLAVWVVPMAIEQPGGLVAWWRATDDLWGTAARATSALTAVSPRRAAANREQALVQTLVAVGPLLPTFVVGLVGVAWRRPPRAWRGALVLVAATLPAFLVGWLVHFGKGGYVVGYLAPVAVLALLPAARAGGRWRAAASVLLALAVVVGAQRFVAGTGVLPRTAHDDVPTWLADSRNGAPYRFTRDAMTDAVDEVAWLRELRRVAEPGRDVVVFLQLNGGHRYRHGAWALPELEVHHLGTDGRDDESTHRGVTRIEDDGRLHVGSGGHAVVVVDEPTADLLTLVAAGRAQTVTLSTGRPVWLVAAPATLFGTRLAVR